MERAAQIDRERKKIKPPRPPGDFAAAFIGLALFVATLYWDVAGLIPFVVWYALVGLAAWLSLWRARETGESIRLPLNSVLLGFILWPLVYYPWIIKWYRKENQRLEGMGMRWIWWFVAAFTLFLVMVVVWMAWNARQLIG